MLPLNETLKFVSMGTALHPADQVNALVHHASTSRYSYVTYAVDEIVTFYIYDKTSGISNKWAGSRNAIYAFCHDFGLNQLSHQMDEKYEHSNSVRLSPGERTLLKTNLIVQYQVKVRELPFIKQRVHAKMTEIRDRKSKQGLSHSRPIYRIGADTDVLKKRDEIINKYRHLLNGDNIKEEKKPTETVKPVKPVKPVKFQPTHFRLMILDNTLTLKESVLASFHLLNAEGRKEYRTLWIEIEAWMNQYKSGKSILDVLGSKEKDERLLSLHNIHDRLSALLKQTLNKQEKSNSNVEFQILLSHIHELEKTIRTRPNGLDVVTEHQLNTALKDCEALMEMYDRLPIDRQEHWNQKIEDGLTDTVKKLEDISSAVVDDMDRAIERQLILLKER